MAVCFFDPWKKGTAYKLYDTVSFGGYNHTCMINVDYCSEHSPISQWEEPPSVMSYWVRGGDCRCVPYTKADSDFDPDIAGNNQCTYPDGKFPTDRYWASIVDCKYFDPKPFATNFSEYKPKKGDVLIPDVTYEAWVNGIGSTTIGLYDLTNCDDTHEVDALILYVFEMS